MAAGLGRALARFGVRTAVCGALCPVVADHGSRGAHRVIGFSLPGLPLRALDRGASARYIGDC